MNAHDRMFLRTRQKEQESCIFGCLDETTWKFYSRKIIPGTLNRQTILGWTTVRQDELVHAVLSVLHEMVYTTLHSHIQSRKSPTGTSETFASRLSPDWPGNLTERQLQTKDPR